MGYLKMQRYKATNNKSAEITFSAENDTEARHWVINHLDLSENWSINNSYEEALDSQKELRNNYIIEKLYE